METGSITSNQWRHFRSPSFNFLASLINGNGGAMGGSSFAQAFNFLASLINGNAMGGSSQAPRRGAQLLTS